LAWVTAAIVGARNPAEVDGCLLAASLELSQANLKEIAEAIARTGAGGGPTLPRRQA
jgi:aryl-alcohol dehydrogenase-like predicted oxidoreductase